LTVVSGHRAKFGVVEEQTTTNAKTKYRVFFPFDKLRVRMTNLFLPL
jgi:hypothetical protein